jgi:hypothetical protein
VRLTRAAVRLLAVLVVLDLVAATIALGVLQADPLRAAAAAASVGHAKVVVIVGPVGTVTDSYRALADDAISAARGLSDNITAVYSPNATWPVVRRALQGAAIVVYLGHGNGWPSPYRDTLYPPTQNGLGLNPVAGAGDDAHQYFGEAAIAREVHLAPGAVVLLNHLCYASGAGEPGMPNPSLGVAQQRVDNYGAGWLAAGASAVIAEGHLGPAYYVDALLRGRAGAEAAWRRSPTFHDHVVAAASERTPGAAILLDPDSTGSGYYRSLVERPDARNLLAAAAIGQSADPAGPADAGSLVVAGATPPVADLLGSTVAGSVARLAVTFDRRTVPLLPDGLVVGTRWARIAADAGTTTPVDRGAAAAAPPAARSAPNASAPNASAPNASAPNASAPNASAPNASAPASPRDPAGAGVGSTPSLAPTAPPPIDLVVPEALSDLTDTHPAVGAADIRTIPVTLPADTGLYRLVVTLHDPDRVAYNAATQDLVRALIVQVTGRTWVTYNAPDRVAATAGQALSIAIRVANTGSVAWGPLPLGKAVDPEPAQPEPQPQVTGHWLLLDGGSPAPASVDGFAGSVPAAYLAPGSSAVVNLLATAPHQPGSYLLVVDLVTSDGTSLAAAGVPPLLVRVVVVPVAAESAAPTLAPGTSP